jgi:hypothetical protein
MHGDMMMTANYAMNLPVRPVTRLADTAPPRISSNGGGQVARPSRPAGYRGRYASRGPMSPSRIAPLLIVVMALTSTALANKAIRPTLQNTSGAWVGVEDEGRRLYRLTLRPDGTGTLAVAWLSSRRDVAFFRVERVEFQSAGIRLAGTSSDSPTTALALSGKAYPRVMLLNLKMSTPWKATISFYAEPDWTAATNDVGVSDAH